MVPLGRFVFVNRLLPLLKTDARVVVLSSAGHRFSDVDLNDPDFEHTPYQAFVPYGRSKTANVLFAVGLDRRIQGRGVRASAMHPGAIQTELSRHMTPNLVQQATAGRGIGSVNFKTIPQSAATTVWAGFRAPAEEVGGRYCEDCHVAAIIKGPTVRTGVRPYAFDPARANALDKERRDGRRALPTLGIVPPPR